jgi:peroxiredoxin
MRGLLLLSLAFLVPMGDPERRPEPGEAAPAFSAPASDGTTTRLADHAGKVVVLAFFPKAFTGG